MKGKQCEKTSDLGSETRDFITSRITSRMKFVFVLLFPLSHRLRRDLGLYTAYKAVREKRHLKPQTRGIVGI
jgi:hypothetical protein